MLPKLAHMCRGTLFALCGFLAKATGSLSRLALEWTLMIYTITRARGRTAPLQRESSQISFGRHAKGLPGHILGRMD